jgi:hypothetical protein
MIPLEKVKGERRLDFGGMSLIVYRDGSVNFILPNGTVYPMSRPDGLKLEEFFTLKDCDHPEHIYYPGKDVFYTSTIGKSGALDTEPPSQNKQCKFICRYCGDWLTRAKRNGKWCWETYRKAGTFDLDGN